MHTNHHLNNGSSMDRKRKRRDSGSLRVRFCTEPSEIIDTYSPFEYNRSGLFPDVDQEQVNYQQTSDYHINNNKNNIIWTFSIGFMSSSPTTTNTTTPTTPVKKNKGEKKKPKLSIDTSNIQDGPLYFSKMTTNHQKKEDMPLMTALPDDDLDARITMENTEINRRCLVAAV